MVETVINTIISILVTVLASSGFWAFLQVKKEKHDGKTQLLLALAHDRIVFLGMSYVERGYISKEEYHNLHDMIYLPYLANGGNGSAKKVMQEVDKLPMLKPVYITGKDDKDGEVHHD